MSIVRVEKNTYTADPLYQWDVKQTLEIYGLSLPSIPEIHYTNAAMERAVVRPATMDAAGVVRAEIPDALLQKPYKIAAYVCIYEGGAFRSLYKIEIKVKERPQPSDYVIVDDPDIYSFNALESKIDNVLRDYSTIEAKYAEAVELLEQTNAKLEEAEQAYAIAVQQVEATAKTAAENVVAGEVAKVTPESLGVYTKEQDLSAETREQYELGETAVPDDVFRAIKSEMGVFSDGLALLASMVSGNVRIAYGTVLGGTTMRIETGFKPLVVLFGETGATEDGASTSGYKSYFVSWHGNAYAVPVGQIMYTNESTATGAVTYKISAVESLFNRNSAATLPYVELTWGDDYLQVDGPIYRYTTECPYVVIGIEGTNEEATA